MSDPKTFPEFPCPVYYRGEIWWAKRRSEGGHILISNDRGGRKDEVAFHVHEDCLELAVTVKARTNHGKNKISTDAGLVKVLTPAAAARREASKPGPKPRDVNEEYKPGLKKAVVEKQSIEVLQAVERLYEAALAIFGEDFAPKYGHLNIGQQSMNLRNRIRAALKKDEKKVRKIVDKLCPGVFQ